MKIVCSKCRKKMDKVILSKYEYVKKSPLHDIPAYKCKKCDNLFFTEKMINRMEKQNKE